MRYRVLRSRDFVRHSRAALQMGQHPTESGHDLQQIRCDCIPAQRWRA